MVNEITMRLLNLFLRYFKKAPKPAGRKFGWKRDLHDPRDFKFKVSAPTAPRVLPPLIDMRPEFPPVYDQQDLGSCTGNALGAAYQYGDMKQGNPSFIPSRLFIYYNERVIEGTVNEDNGAMIRTGIKTLVDSGVCPEDMWKYNTWKFKKKPCPECYTAALDNQVLQYLRISPHTIQGVKEALADGFPVVFGFTLYESFMTETVARTGMATPPLPNEAPIGGHAVLAVGYDDSKQCLIVRNSWGENWGLKGYFYLPYWYITTPNAAADFWVIKLVE
jgi:C1A family cysteine protease